MGNCAGKPKKPEEATSKPAPAKVEESKPVQPKLKEEDDPNSPFFRGPRPDPPKPAPAKPATPENQKVTADVHEAEVVDSKGCSALIPDVPAPCSTTCEVEEEAVNVPQDQVEDKELELPTRPSRVSFTQGEKSEDDAHPIARTPTPVAVEEVRVSQEEEDEPVREPTPKTFTPEPVREPTPKPVTPEPVQEITRSRTSSGSASISTCSSIQHDQEIADFVKATSAPAVETARQEVQNIEIEDVIEDDIIQPIHRQYSEKGASDKISGATLEEYRSKIDADAGDVGDEIAKALEELESAQTALDHTKHISVMEETVSALQEDLQSSFDLSLDNRKPIDLKSTEIEDADQDEIEEKLIPVKVTAPDEPISRDDAADVVANVLSRSLTLDDEDVEIDIDVSESRIDDVDDELPVGSPELEELDSTDVLDINRSATDSRPSEPTPSAYTPNDSQAFFPSSPVENTPSPTVQDYALETMAAEIAAEALEIEKLGIEEEILKKAEDEIKLLKAEPPSDLPELEDVSCEPGEIEYDYVKKDLEPGNDTLDLITSNEKVLTKLDDTNPEDIVLSPVLSPAPDAERKSPDFGEIENIPTVVDEIKKRYF